MKLLTKAIEHQLNNPALTGQNALYPICKFFNPTGAATWLIFARDHDCPDILWGLADLGMGYIEYGTISLSELEDLKVGFGLGVERDLHFTPKKYPNGELWEMKKYLELNSLSGV